jgi:hypothetical protein
MFTRSGIACTIVLGVLLTAGCASRTPAMLAGAAPAASTPTTFHETEGKLGRTPAAALARTLGCPDFEPQERAPGVGAQVSCGIGGHRIYVQTFTGSHVPRKYVQAGPGPKPVGADLIGPGWIIHVDDASFAATVKAKVGGRIVPAS